MGALHRRRASWLILATLTCMAGCSGEDTERLAHVGRKVVEKIETATGNADGKLLGGLTVMRGTADQLDLAGRVSARLHWDKALTDVKIEVSATGAALELRGTVREQAQKQRAVQLAESTEGVDKVTDNLEVVSKAQ
jgi:hyperosmotically inducible protein